MRKAAHSEVRKGYREPQLPNRNIWCPEYDACLGKAAASNCSLSCCKCPNSSLKVAFFVLTLSEIEGCKALVRAIFEPG